MFFVIKWLTDTSTFLVQEIYWLTYHCFVKTADMMEAMMLEIVAKEKEGGEEEMDLLEEMILKMVGKEKRMSTMQNATNPMRSTPRLSKFQ